MNSLRGWAEQNGNSFYEIMSKLDESDLRPLCDMFNCTPRYFGYPIEKKFYITNLWNKFHLLMQEKERYNHLLEAMRTLGMNPILPF